MGPGRPPNERDIQLNCNGSPQYLGTLVSSGTRVNNSTTTKPFNATPLGPGNFIGTLAGKTLLLQPTATGLLLPADTAALTVEQQSGTTAPGVSVAAGERVIVIMLPTQGFLQWLPVTGSANLLVWELV